MSRRPTRTGPRPAFRKGSSRNFVSIILSIFVCCSLLVSTLALTHPAPVKGQEQSPRVIRQAGAPGPNLPNLDELRRTQQPSPETPSNIPSTIRSPRKPLAPRNGRKVGDPLPPEFQGLANRAPNRGPTIDSNTKEGTLSIESSRSRASMNSLALAFKSSPSLRRSQKSRLNHAGARGEALGPSPIGDDQYVQTFFQWALARQPYTNPNEQGYWDDILRAAYAHGQPSMVLAVREMGKTLFESAEYATRGRSNHDYVYDLYQTYLLRNPDSNGWAYWESVVPSMGREEVRRAFDECTEFSNAVAGVTPNGNASSAVSSLVSARVNPFNQSGDQLRARDAEWSVSLLNLPGRAGLDLGLGLSYSSAAVWTRSGSYIYFDEDNSSLSPGFRLGFPTIQEKYFDAQIGQNAYVVITSAGSRVELRQIGSSNVYEAADSSYLQLTDNSNASPSSLLLRTTDGTQMNYIPANNEWRCNQIKDRNGNYITVNYTNLGDITSITDTLGRVITFNYDGNANLASITQVWNGQTHTWATFGWGTTPVQPGFSGVSVVGAANGARIPVLTQVGFADGTHYNFEYTNAAQVSVIRRYAYTDQLAYTAFDYTGTDNCPWTWRKRDWAELWNGNWGGVPQPSEEAVTTYSAAGDSSWSQQTTPDGTIYKEFYATSGWQTGLPTRTEVWANSAMQKWTTTDWTQDDTNLSYQQNPRVIEANIYDAANNRRRTTVGYYTFTLPDGASCSLPNHVNEYAAAATTVLRQRVTDYNLDADYLGRHLIGLVSDILVYDGSGIPIDKTVYMYDQNWSGYLQATSPAPVQHDETNYPAGSYQGRGNLIWIGRFDANDPGNWDKVTVTTVGYNQTGQSSFAQDALGRRTTIGYNDNWSDSSNHNTFAYPTVVTDPDGFSSYTQYNYDFGAPTRVQGPAPAGQSQGLIQTLAYDGAARLQQVTTANTGAYRRYAYGPNYRQQFTSVNNVADDNYSVQFFDGAGRVIHTAGIHPGSSGGWVGQLTYYDNLGRAVQQTNPTEMNGYWVPTGDDAAGWVWSFQSYDWKGRPLVTTNQDGTTKTASYGGCGCAGGEVVTVQDEIGRQQRTTSDSFGRGFKTEVLKSDGSVYSATITDYNARDQITATKTYKGAATFDFSCPSGTCMQSVTTYDGYGRAATQKLPQQTIPTSYAYYSDDLVQSVTDPRGVVATNTYNNRHLLTGVSYSAPAAIDAPAPVSFGYDGAGNRTSMADGTGSISYQYDQLSRMTSETRTFAGLSNQYTIGYGYNIGGGLTSITDPSGAQVSYNYDQTGRLTSMPAIGYDGVTQFLSNAQYRAFGGMKHATYGNSLQVDLNYNERMQIGQYQASGFQSYNGTPYTMGATMSYYADGRTNTAFDLNDGKFDRKYEFDFSARLKEAYSGIEAHGQPAPPLNQANSPYRQSYTYDEWNNALSRSGRVWTVNDGDGANYTSNNKRQGWGYDTAGNALTTNDGAYTYDAAGRPVTFVSSQTWQAYGGWDSNHPNSPALETADIFDGSGQIARHVNHTRIDESHDSEYGFVYWLNDSTTTSYYVHSTVLGGKTIAELNQNGAKTTGYVYAGGARIATQHVYVSTNAVEITCTNPVTGSAITTDANAAYALRQEPDALGRDLATPPDHGLVSEPLSNPLFKDRVMPIEYTGGPSDYYEQGNADWAAERAEYTAQYQAGYFDAGGYFDLKHQFIGALINLALSGNNQYFDEANQILANNPNFALQINGKMTAGQDAANALTTAFANLPGDPVALNRPKFAHASHNAAPPRSGNSTMIITWDVDEPWSPVGHVSYITMQDDTSYSWDMDSGHYYNQEWTIATPSSKYTDKRSESSEGHGYILDFGGELNSKFQNALLHAYDGGWFGHKRSYDPVSDNCGQAFNIAINAISKDIGLKPIHIVSPWEIRKYIENNLRNYIAATTPYPKH